jgi:GT2 family glycosyltransferase
MSRTVFSAVIPHRNRRELLTQSLQVLGASWGRHLAEVIVVDDASEPSQVPQSRRLGERARVIMQPQQCGPAACRNRGAREATGDVLLFLDDDSRPHCGSLESLAAMIRRRPTLAAVGFRVLIGSHCESGGAFNVVVGCGAAVCRRAFLRVGGFPEDFGFYAEEYGLCYRLLEAGYEVEMWSEPAVFHDKSSRHRDPAGILRRLVINNRRLLEPHVAAIPDVGRRLAEILNWYRVLAQRLQVDALVESAFSQPLALSQESHWTDGLWRSISGLEQLDLFARRLVADGVRRVSLWPVGKDSATFASALRSVGIEPLVIVDPQRRYELNSFAELPVAQQVDHTSDGIVVASFSPGLCWNARRGHVPAGHVPVWTGFDYIVPESPSDPE